MAVGSISAGYDFTCALLTGGTVECWGDSGYGELGNGATTGPDTCNAPDGCSTTPVAVTGLSGVTAISAGFESACALLTGGTVECWGDNQYDALGNSTADAQTSSSMPVAVTGF